MTTLSPKPYKPLEFRAWSAIGKEERCSLPWPSVHTGKLQIPKCIILSVAKAILPNQMPLKAPIDIEYRQAQG